MSDNDRIVFPDEYEDMKEAAAETEATKTNSIEEPPEESPVEPTNVIIVPPNCLPGLYSKMADDDRVIFPDEYEKMKAAAAETEATKTNSIEEPPAESPVKPTNAITAPPNCPPGQQRDADGICRDVF